MATPPGSYGQAGQLFTKETQSIFYNWKALPVQRMLDFDWLCGRKTPSVACIVQPGSGGGFQKVFFGKEEIAIPQYGTTAEAAAAHPRADVFVNFASFRSAFESTFDALKLPTVRVVAVIAEGVPERDTKTLIAYAKEHGKVVLGPATVGGVQAGAFKIGDAAGTLENIVECKLYRPGSVGFVSKSGGMSNEMYNVLARATDGIYEGIAIGGDAFPGSTLSEHCLRYERIPAVKLIVVLGEIGGRDEYSLVDAIKDGRITKPVVAWVSGTCAKLFSSEVQFGHAGAKSGGDDESAQAKNAALAAAGAVVPSSFEDLEPTIKRVWTDLVERGVVTPVLDALPSGAAPAEDKLGRPVDPAVAKATAVPPPPSVPEDLAAAKRAGKVRVPTHVVSTICDDRGEEPTFAGVTMSKLMGSGATVADAVSLLWFKRRLPTYAARFVEMCIVLCADHGPCVSGAHNAIVTSRAGKDLISSLVSGLLTIGPRFGGAIDDAARNFKRACDKNQEPDEFVEELKKAGIRVPGIGHRIKSKDNRDKRVELLQRYARQHFSSTRYLDYAVRVEEYTLGKAANLVLNVDGCIGALFIDLLVSTGQFTKQEVDDVVRIGYLNGLFVLARSIGLIGHALDQKRLGQPLYRHPWDDVLYA